ncbi:MAG: hypothetical protein Q9217_003937 [Psora testacea]
MHFLQCVTIAVSPALVVATPQLPTINTINTATATSDIAAAQATAATNSETSNVKGKAFDRFVVIWLENTDYASSFDDRLSSLFLRSIPFTDLTLANIKELAQQGITLTNYFAVTHPSEPNYIASVGGEYFGMDNDNFLAVPSNVSTVVDLIEDKGISWAEYQEDMPYTGFEGFQYRNKDGKNDYVRKHKYVHQAGQKYRLAHIKNFTLFYEDLKNNKLPQWMFITPNMTNDGHDTSIAVAGAWANGFLTPLINDPQFMNGTCVMLTFDENETYEEQNRIEAILLGDAIPNDLKGTTDANYYTHYSEISTIEANWDLNTLGRWDVGANVFSYVADKTGDQIRSNPDLSTTYNNQSYPGILTAKEYAPQPVPNIHLTRNGRQVLPAIQQLWKGMQDQTYYTDSVEIPDGLHPPVYPS